MPSHGRHYCADCGFARIVPFLPFLFVISRNLFVWFYLIIFIILGGIVGIECNILCNEHIDRSQIVFSHSSKPIFIIALISHIMYPICFILMLRLKLVKNYFRKERNFAGSVITTIRSVLNAVDSSGNNAAAAKSQDWGKFDEFLSVNFDNIISRRIDINEIDETNGRTALLYAAIEHQFDLMKELIDRYRADVHHRDINNHTICDLLNMPHERDRYNGPTRVIRSGNAVHLQSLMIEYGCDMNSYDGFGNTALIQAAMENESNLMQLMFELAEPAIEIDKPRIKVSNNVNNAYNESKSPRKKSAAMRQLRKQFDEDEMDEYEETNNTITAEMDEMDLLNEHNDNPHETLEDTYNNNDINNNNNQHQNKNKLKEIHFNDDSDIDLNEMLGKSKNNDDSDDENDNSKRKGSKRKNSKQEEKKRKVYPKIPETALLIAGEKGFIECVKILLDNGADCGATSYEIGKNPIVQRIYDKGHKECARMIHKHIQQLKGSGNSRSRRKRHQKGSIKDRKESIEVQMQSHLRIADESITPKNKTKRKKNKIHFSGPQQTKSAPNTF